MDPKPCHVALDRQWTLKMMQPSFNGGILKTSKEANLRAGRKKAILDLFGEWRPSDEYPLGELERLPPSVVRASKILIWGFIPLESDHFLLAIYHSGSDHGPGHC